MDINFISYEKFKEGYRTYHFDKCDSCSGIREIKETNLNCVIDDRTLIFPSMMVLYCKSCGKECLPQHTKEMINSAYRTMINAGQFCGEFISKGYKKKFDYCQGEDYKYDYRDYYNIPGLSFDEEHAKEGFLTPVYFDKKALIYFVSVLEFEVNIFSETYGHIAKRDLKGVYQYEWVIPFGFNSNGKMVIWLGDIEDLDEQSKAVLKSFNIESDHLLIDSEFYQAQMNCVFSEPIIEKQVLLNKQMFVNNVNVKYGIDLSHLIEECSIHEDDVNRPIVFTEKSVSGVINAYDKILIEGFNVEQLRILYESLYEKKERNKEYTKWQSIKLIESVLIKFGEGVKDINMSTLMSPLYILHDYRIYFDHLLSNEKREKTKMHILNTLGISDFNDQEAIYNEEIHRLSVLFQHLAILTK